MVIIAFNEEDNIAACIDSVGSLADEVVVIDSFSTDTTASMAEAKGARLLRKEFKGYIEQKNFATEAAANDFVLNLDADERLSPLLLSELKKEKEKGFPFSAYAMNRLNFYCGRPVKSCGWYPDTKVRLWNRKVGRWVGGLVHEKMELDEDVSVKKLEGDILHYTYNTKQELVNQVNRFSDLAARQLKTKSSALLVLKMFFSPVVKFVRNYVFNLGFADGNVGLVICYQQAREVFLKYRKALALK